MWRVTFFKSFFTIENFGIGIRFSGNNGNIKCLLIRDECTVVPVVFVEPMVTVYNSACFFFSRDFFAVLC